MDFIDHTGHIFNQQSFNEKPTGYEYEENRYIFWFDTEYGYKLSVNNYYFKPIRILYPIVSQTDDINVSISIFEGNTYEKNFSYARSYIQSAFYFFTSYDHN